MAVEEVVVGSTRKQIVDQVLDKVTGLPINITGGAFLLEGTSLDLPSKQISQAGTITDAANGVVTWSSVGSYVTSGDMGALKQALFTLRWRFTDAAAKIDWSSTFQLNFVMPPF
jgi:hypothetical protein